MKIYHFAFLLALACWLLVLPGCGQSDSGAGKPPISLNPPEPDPMIRDTDLAQLRPLFPLKPCPQPDPNRYPAENPAAAALYEKAVTAARTVPEKLPPEGVTALYQQAAEKGHWGAMYNLAVRHHQGNGTPENNAKALYWFQQLEKLGIPEGFEGMANVYERGIGVPIDRDKARSYQLKAVQAGSADAMYSLGHYIMNNYRTDPDFAKFDVQLWECAAAQGHRKAHWWLALSYNVDEQNHLAYRWLRRGAKAGEGSCIRALSDGYDRWKTWAQLNLMEDKERAKCLFNLAELLRSNPDLTFPDLDERCPPNVAQPNVNDDPFPPPRKR